MSSEIENCNNTPTDKVGSGQEKDSPLETEAQTQKVESEQEKNIKSSHHRLIHRLTTARWTVWGGIMCIIILIGITFFTKFYNDQTLEIIRTTISTLATIVTLALGYIAGSNIEGSKD